jgi:methionine aminopeptidase
LFRDLGIHIDGYVAVIGHTVVVGASKVLIIAKTLLQKYFDQL